MYLQKRTSIVDCSVVLICACGEHRTVGWHANLSAWSCWAPLVSEYREALDDWEEQLSSDAAHADLKARLARGQAERRNLQLELSYVLETAGGGGTG